MKYDLGLDFFDGFQQGREVSNVDDPGIHDRSDPCCGKEIRIGLRLEGHAEEIGSLGSKVER
jgi:hypothetical protein